MSGSGRKGKNQNEFKQTGTKKIKRKRQQATSRQMATSDQQDLFEDSEIINSDEYPVPEAAQQVRNYVTTMALLANPITATAKLVGKVAKKVIVSTAESAISFINSLESAGSTILDMAHNKNDQYKIDAIKKIVADLKKAFGEDYENQLRTRIEAIDTDTFKEILQLYNQKKKSNTSPGTQAAIIEFNKNIEPNVRAKLILDYMFKENNWKRFFCLTLWSQIGLMMQCSAELNLISANDKNSNAIMEAGDRKTVDNQQSNHRRNSSSSTANTFELLEDYASPSSPKKRRAVDGKPISIYPQLPATTPPPDVIAKSANVRQFTPRSSVIQPDNKDKTPAQQTAPKI